MELVEHRVRPVDGGRVRLEGEILYADGARELVWFDFPESLESAVNRTGDPWIVALAPLAMTLRETLRVPLPADARLVEGLRRASRAWHYWDDTRGELELDVPLGEAIQRGCRVGSLFSGGVDSWYTVLNNQREAEAGRLPALDALLLVWGADIPLHRPEAFHALRQRLGAVASAVSCELVDVATNLRSTRWETTDWAKLSHGSLFLSLAHATGHFRRLLIPSSVTYSNGRGWGSHPVTDPLLSSHALAIVYDAAEYNRLSKMSLVCTSDLALACLRVCWRSGTDQNCGRCMKCLRTMILLELHGSLVRCPTFPSTRVDLDQVRHIRCVSATDYRMLRNLTTEAYLLNRPDMGRALVAAATRSSRLDLASGILTGLDRAGVRGATRLRSWLERGDIRN